MRRIKAMVKRFTGGGGRRPATAGRRPARGGGASKGPGGILDRVRGGGRRGRSRL